MSSDWIQLYNSEYFDFEKSTYHNISIETIAHSLSLQCRFNGHCENFYSVGEHSVLVSNRVLNLSDGDPLCGLHALLHDASEALLCDLPRPVKYLDGSEWYRKMEFEIQENLLIRFIGNLDFSSAEKITKQADLEMLATEKEQVMGKVPLDWGYLPDTLDIEIQGYSPFKSKTLFLDKYYNLKDKFENE